MFIKGLYLSFILILTCNLHASKTLSALGLPVNQVSIEERNTYILGKNANNQVIWSICYITKEQSDSIQLWVEKKEPNSFHLVPLSILYNYYGEKPINELKEISKAIPFPMGHNLWQEAQRSVHNYVKIMDRIWITTLLGKKGPIIHMLGIKGQNIQSQAFYITQDSIDLESSILPLYEVEQLSGQILFPKISSKLKSFRSSPENTLASPKALEGLSNSKPQYLPVNPEIDLIYKDTSILSTLLSFDLEKIKNIGIKRIVAIIEKYWIYILPFLLAPFVIWIIIIRRKNHKLQDLIIFNLRKIGHEFKGEITKTTLNCEHPPISVSYRKGGHKHYSHTIEIRRERNDGETWKFEAYDGKQMQKLPGKLQEFTSTRSDLEHITVLSAEGESGSSTTGNRLNSILDVNTWRLLANYPPHRRFHIYMDKTTVVSTFYTMPGLKDEEYIKAQLKLCEKIMRPANKKQPKKKVANEVIL
jgi:hypothetical protein